MVQFVFDGRALKRSCFGALKESLIELEYPFPQSQFPRWNKWDTYTVTLHHPGKSLSARTHHQWGHPIGASPLATNTISEAMLEQTPPPPEKCCKRCCHLEE